MNILYDLHSHTHYSDGELTPQELIVAAVNAEINVLAITDHDTVAACQALAMQALPQNIDIIWGVEISTTWRQHTIHLIGLKIDIHHPQLLAGLLALQQLRRERAKKIADKLAEQGILDAYAAVSTYTHEELIARPHFARLLVERKVVSNVQQAFQQYLKHGRPAFVAMEWIGIATAIDWIHQSGGLAILAHPARYQLTATQLINLITDFKAAGGIGMEVSSSAHQVHDVQRLAYLCQKYDLYASVGSDYHGPNSRAKLGKYPLLPDNCCPIWNLWR